ncbi:MAG TPA: DUF885 domain-containing protein [Bryobacteraceae bacterium]|nr:DUF885 domain-containing protein [Bryobacteraceae bacterium]
MNRVTLAVLSLVAMSVQLPAANTPAWVARSNENALYVLKGFAHFGPEGVASLGIDGFDDQILDLKPKIYERSQEYTREVIKNLESRLANEKDPLVRQDLEILIDSLQKNLHGSEVQHNYQISYSDLPQTVFTGIHALLDDQIAASRRPAALIRLKKYVGLVDGYEPLSKLAEDRIRESLKRPGLVGPPKAEVEKNLANSAFFVNGIGQLFEKYKIEGYQEAFARLKDQLKEYDEFTKREILPRARTDFRLPPALYSIQQEQVGVDVPPPELAQKARAAFTEIQGQMQTIAGQMAKENGWSFSDYRDVIRQLKKDQIVGDAIMEHYRKRLAQIEDIVRREHLVTLPDRPAIIRVASAAESAQQPAPHMQPPRLVGNTGERGEFVLPLNAPSTDGKLEKFDDFTFDAASWTLTAHEARPGHELQFDSMVEHGVSLARAIFAFNSTNVEGWGLYAEWVMEPYLPPDGHLICLQHRLMRAARAFLDPELHLGKITPEEALRVLKQDVVISEPMAKQEVERYMYRMPAQATSYFYGYTRLLDLRKETEKALGNKFNAQRFHDFILSEGLLPPDLMRKAVMDDFVKPQLAGNSGL